MWFEVLAIPFIAVFGILLGLLYKGVDRILVARMQSRVGPPLTQPFRDVAKLMAKDNVVPRNAVKWLFNMMPVVALSTVLVILLYLPLGPVGPVLEGDGDLILVLYLLILPSLALVLGGFSSGSPYATVGAQREMVTIMSYEFPLAITSVSIAWLLSSTSHGWSVFSLGVIASNPVWGLVGSTGFMGLVLLFLLMLFVMAGELGRVPFDVSKADTEIAGGLLVEYSGRNLALFYIADAVKTVAVGSLVVALFLPWNLSTILGLGGLTAEVVDTLFFLVKLLAVLFVGSTLVRVSTARLRINQVVYVYWIPGVLLSLFGLLLIWVDVTFLALFY
jgi:formate hydrogenlyase subunit 4